MAKKNQKNEVFYDSDTLKAIKENMRISPHTALLMRNPVHAYICTGDECRKKYNEEWERQYGKDAPSGESDAAE